MVRRRLKSWDPRKREGGTERKRGRGSVLRSRFGTGWRIGSALGEKYVLRWSKNGKLSIFPSGSYKLTDFVKMGAWARSVTFCGQCQAPCFLFGLPACVESCLF